MRRAQGIAAAALTAGLAGLASGQTVVIDDFMTGDFEFSGRASSQTTTPAASVLGGERELDWEIASNPFNTRFSTQTAFNGGSGLAVDAGSGMVARAILTYDGMDGGDGLNFDATTDNLGAVLVATDFADEDVSIEVQLTDVTGATIALTRIVSEGFISQGTSFFFDSFDGSEGFDFTEIDSVQVTINVDAPPESAGLDVFVSNIAFVVPAPGSLALLGLGGLLATGRRRG